MVWSIDSPSEKPETKTLVRVDSVLYEYDGPQLFRGRFGLIDSVFVKIDEIDGDDLWLCAMADDRLMSLIERNQISVRSAFAANHLWVVQTDISLAITRYWPCDQSNIDDSLLPESGAALDPDVARVPDTIEQATSFFSIGFKGKDLASESMKFSTFKQLVDNAYAVTRKILGPKAIEGSKSGTFDLQIVPQIGSLIISVEAPLLNIGRIEQKLADTLTTFEDVQVQMDTQKAAFFAGLQSAVKSVAYGEANEDLSEAAKEALEDVLYIIPTEDYKFESIEFSTNINNIVSTIFIDNGTGGRIRRALDRSQYERGTRAGVIVEINAEANTFLIKSRTGRLTTCVCPAEIYARFQESQYLEIGTKISVTGSLEKRKRRDRIFVQKYPDINN